MSVNLKIEEIRELLNNNLSDEIDELLDDIRILSDAKDSALKTSNKPALNIADVSKQRELLIAFKNWEVDNDIKNLLSEDVVDFYIDESNL